MVTSYKTKKLKLEGTKRKVYIKKYENIQSIKYDIFSMKMH